MIKKSVCLLILIVSSLLLNAQKAEQDQFLANDIYVVYTGAAKMDSALKDNFSKFWTVKPIKGFVTKDELDTLIGNEGNSFIYPRRYTYQSSYGSAVFAFNGGKRNLKKYDLLYESVAIENFDAYLGESEFENSIYRLPLIINKLQMGVKHKYYISRSTFDKNKTLLVNENLVEGKKGASIRRDALAAWPWKYEIMSPEKITKLIREQDSHYLLLVPVVTYLTSELELYDLASLRSVAKVSGTAAFKSYWVHSKEIQRLVDKVNEGKLIKN